MSFTRVPNDDNVLIVAQMERTRAEIRAVVDRMDNPDFGPTLERKAREEKKVLDRKLRELAASVRMFEMETLKNKNIALAAASKAAREAKLAAEACQHVTDDIVVDDASDVESNASDHAADFETMAVHDDDKSSQPLAKEQSDMYLANEDDGADFGDDMSDGDVPRSANNVNLTVCVSAPVRVTANCSEKGVSFGPDQVETFTSTDSQSPAPNRLCPSVAASSSSASASASVTSSAASVSTTVAKKPRKARLSEAERLRLAAQPAEKPEGPVWSFLQHTNLGKRRAERAGGVEVIREEHRRGKAAVRRDFNAKRC